MFNELVCYDYVPVPKTLIFGNLGRREKILGQTISDLMIIEEQSIRGDVETGTYNRVSMSKLVLY